MGKLVDGLAYLGRRRRPSDDSPMMISSPNRPPKKNIYEGDSFSDDDEGLGRASTFNLDTEEEEPIIGDDGFTKSVVSTFTPAQMGTHLVDTATM
jgi:hypothetical protein